MNSNNMREEDARIEKVKEQAFLIGAKAKERFCKDCNIPIKIFVEPYFSERIVSFDNFYDSINQWLIFTKDFIKIGNEKTFEEDEKNYFEEYNRIKDAAIDSIKQSKGYYNFIADDMSRYSIAHKNISNKNIYSEENCGEKCFISVDMKKANYSALKYFNPEIFNNTKSWEDFIGQFTEIEHIKRSKYIRQVVLGNCNPKRQSTYEKYLMDKILTAAESLMLPVKSFLNDEILFGPFVDTDLLNVSYYVNKIKELAKNLNLPVEVQPIRLRKIEETSAYIKEILDLNTNIFDKKITLKCLSPDIAPFVIKALEKKDITDNDTYFVYDNKLAKYVNCPINYWAIKPL